MKTMLIDDSQTMRAIQRGVVSQLGGVEIAECSSAEDALVRLDAFVPDLILIDRALPGMDGPAFIREARKRGTDAAVIVIAAAAEREAVIESINAGATSYLAKPFTPDVLSQCITEALACAGGAPRA